MESTNANGGLRRVEIRAVFQRNRGSQKQLAVALGVSSTAVFLWLSGKSKSARIGEAAAQRALQLLEAERTRP